MGNFLKITVKMVIFDDIRHTIFVGRPLGTAARILNKQFYSLGSRNRNLNPKVSKLQFLEARSTRREGEEERFTAVTGRECLLPQQVGFGIILVSAGARLGSIGLGYAQAGSLANSQTSQCPSTDQWRRLVGAIGLGGYPRCHLKREGWVGKFLENHRHYGDLNDIHHTLFVGRPLIRPTDIKQIILLTRFQKP